MVYERSQYQREESTFYIFIFKSLFYLEPMLNLIIRKLIKRLLVIFDLIKIVHGKQKGPTHVIGELYAIGLNLGIIDGQIQNTKCISCTMVE